MKRAIKNWFKRLFKVFSDRDLDHALANLGSVKDRTEFEWKLKRFLESNRNE